MVLVTINQRHNEMVRDNVNDAQMLSPVMTWTMECAVMCSRESVLCTLQEVYSVYTARRVQWVASDWTRKRRWSKNKIWMAVRGRGSYLECFLECILPRFPLASFVLRELLHRSPLVWPHIILSTVLLLSFPSRRPLVCAPPGCRRPLRRGWWGWEFTFFCEVLLPTFAYPYQVFANFRIEFIIQSLSFFRWNMYNFHFSSRLSSHLGYC